MKQSAAKVKAAVAKNLPKPTKEEKQAKQQAKVSAAKAQEQKAAANKAHANSLFEEALA